MISHDQIKAEGGRCKVLIKTIKVIIMKKLRELWADLSTFATERGTAL